METIQGHSRWGVLHQDELDIGFVPASGNRTALIGVVGEGSLFRYADANHGTMSFRGVPLGGHNSPERQYEYVLWLLRMVHGARMFRSARYEELDRGWVFEERAHFALDSPYSFGYELVRLGRLSAGG